MHVLKNNLFMLNYVWKYKKSMIFLKLFISALGAVYTFIDIYFIKWIFDALETKESITFLFAIIAIAGAIHIFVSFTNSIYNNIIQPKMSLNVSERINNEMIDKAQSIDLSCYENAEFFDKYTRALSETDGRVNGVLNTFSGIISAVLNITVIISLYGTSITSSDFNGKSIYNKSAKLSSIMLLHKADVWRKEKNDNNRLIELLKIFNSFKFNQVTAEDIGHINANIHMYNLHFNKEFFNKEVMLNECL